MSAENQNPNAMDETIVNEMPAPPTVQAQKGTWLPLAGLVSGVLALLVAAGGLVTVQMGKASHDEVQALRSELKKRDALSVEMQKRIDTLVGEVAKLNEAEVQRVEAAEKAAKAALEAAEEEARKAAEAAEAAAKAAAEKDAKDKGKGKAPAKPGADERTDKTKPGTQVPPAPRSNAVQSPVAAAPIKNTGLSCDLIGKSPEEQAAILKRCVSLMDPPAKPR